MDSLSKVKKIVVVLKFSEMFSRMVLCRFTILLCGKQLEHFCCFFTLDSIRCEIKFVQSPAFGYDYFIGGKMLWKSCWGVRVLDTCCVPYELFRRINGNVLFWNRTWEDYKNGFGSFAQNNFWLGLDKIHALVNRSNRPYVTLRTELTGNRCKSNCFYWYNPGNHPPADQFHYAFWFEERGFFVSFFWKFCFQGNGMQYIVKTVVIHLNV